MKRPHLVHFVSILGPEYISIRASVTMKQSVLSDHPDEEDRFPIQAFRLLNAYQFTLKIIGFDVDRNEIFSKSFDSDSFGNFFFKIPLYESTRKIHTLQIYETRRFKGLEMILGTYLPLRLSENVQMVICDFDKTLVDTKYSTTREVYQSLTKPLKEFPTLQGSVDLLHDYIDKGYHPFILSASPHFYEDAMRDWLYQHNIFSAGIFLKDYREVFSLFDGELTPKDLKVQGLYKINHLLDILLMTGVPDKLVLIGDNFESDPLIYATLAKLIKDEIEPRYIWQKLADLDIFKTSRKQRSHLLNKMYQLNNLVTRKKNNRKEWPPEIRIFIRRKLHEETLEIPPFFAGEKGLIQLFTGPSPLDE